MSSTGKTNRLALSQFQGTDRPSWLGDYNEDMSAIDSFAGTGWAALPPCTWFTTTQMKIAGDITSFLSVGDKIRLVQFGIVKYFYCTWLYFDGTDTNVALTGGSDYALEYAEILSPCFSKAASPVGFPDWFNYSPTFGANGGMTYASVTATAKFKICGRECRGFVDAKGTTGGTASNTLSFTAPVTPNPLLSYSGHGYIYDGSNYVLSSVFFVTTSFSVAKYNLANIVLGAGVLIRVGFSFPI